MGELVSELGRYISSPEVADTVAASVQGAARAAGAALAKSGSKVLRGTAESRSLSAPLALGFVRALRDARYQDPPDEDVWWERATRLYDILAERQVSRILVKALHGLDTSQPVDSALVRRAVAEQQLDLDRLARDMGVDIELFLFRLRGTLLDELMEAAYSDSSALRGIVNHAILQEIVRRLSPREIAHLTQRQLRDRLIELLQRIETRVRRDLADLPYIPSGSDVEQLDQAVPVRVGLRRSVSDTTPESAYSPPSARPHGGITRIVNWDEASQVHHRLVVLADPGFGKTWRMSIHAIRLALTARRALESGAEPTTVTIPLLLRCDELALEDGDLGQASVARLAKGLGLSSAIETWLAGHVRERNGAVVLLDALDEITDADRRRVYGQLADWDDNVEQGQIIIGSRLANYSGPPPRRVNWTEVELQPYNPDDIARFLDARGLSEQARQSIEQRLERPEFAGMAQVPLLLAMLCDAAAAEEALPSTRVDLYEQMLRRFLRGEHRENSSQASRALQTSAGGGRANEQRLLAVLRPIAMKFADSPHGWLDRMGSEAVLDAIRNAGAPFRELGLDAPSVLSALSIDAGVLVPAGASSRGADPDYLFAHRTFSEYLVASHLVHSGQWLAAVNKHLWFEPEWTPVIQMIGELLPDSAELLDQLLDRPGDPLHHSLTVAGRVISELSEGKASSAKDSIIRVAQRLFTLIKEPAFNHAAWTLRDMWAYFPVEIVRSLIGTLEDSDVYSRLAAELALDNHLGSEVTESLLRRLDDESVVVRIGALFALYNRDGEAVTPALVARSTDEIEDVRIAAAKALAKRPGEDVTKALVARLRDDVDDVRAATAEVLASREGEDVTSALLAHLADVRLLGRAELTKALAKRPGEDVTNALIARLTDEVEEVRAAAARALAGRVGEKVSTALLACFEDGRDSVRGAAAAALSGHHGDHLDAALISQLSDPREWVRQAATESLADRQGKSVVPALLDRAGDPSPGVRKEVASALAGRDGDKVTTALLLLLQDNDWRVRNNAAAALADRHDENVTTGLLARADDRDESVRREVASALAGRDGDKVTTALLLLLHDDDWWVRSRAAEALADRHDESVTTGLLARADDRDESVRREVASALAGRDGDKVTTALLLLLQDEEWLVRTSAVEALADRSDRRASAALLARLEDDVEYVRDAAAEALAARDSKDVTAALEARLQDTTAFLPSAASWGLADQPGPQAIDVVLTAKYRDRHVRVPLVARDLWPIAEASARWKPVQRAKFLRALSDLTERWE